MDSPKAHSRRSSVGSSSSRSWSPPPSPTSPSLVDDYLLRLGRSVERTAQNIDQGLTALEPKVDAFFAGGERRLDDLGRSLDAWLTSVEPHVGSLIDTLGTRIESGFGWLGARLDALGGAPRSVNQPATSSAAGPAVAPPPVVSSRESNMHLCDVLTDPLSPESDASSLPEPEPLFMPFDADDDALSSHFPSPSVVPSDLDSFDGSFDLTSNSSLSSPTAYTSAIEQNPDHTLRRRELHDSDGELVELTAEV